jgi:exonuclease SbcD
MQRLALIGDSHYFEHSRLAECVRLHDWIAKDAAARGCNGWVHSGDVFERKSSGTEREFVARWVQQMSNTVGRGVIVRGNHDILGELPLLELLELRAPVRVIEGASVVVMGGVAVACMGWPQRGNLAALLPDKAKEDLEQEAGHALKAVLRGLGDQLLAHENRTRLFLGHVMVRGSTTSTGQPLVGCDFELGLEDLALVNADAYLLGHIHKGQSWLIGEAPVIYPGSPRRTAFGEIEPKGYVVLECDGPHVTWQFVEAPATPMAQLEARWVDGQFDDTDFGQQNLIAAETAGAEVRFRYHVTAAERDAARSAAQAYVMEDLPDAASVKIEEVVESSTRARTPEVAKAKRLDEKIQALWTAKGFEPGERLESLLAKLSLVEQEHANAA